MRKHLLGFYDYTVMLTYCSLLSAVVGMGEIIQGRPVKALICLMMSGFFDMVDGPVAQTKSRTEDEKCFGIQIDSFCDLVAFGVFPGIFLYNALGTKDTMSLVATFIVILAALIRLAFFNVIEQQRQMETDEPRKSFRGMPVTVVALVLPAAWMILRVTGLPIYFLGIVQVVLAFLNLADITVMKPQKTGKIILAIIGLAEMVCLFLIGKGI